MGCGTTDASGFYGRRDVKMDTLIRVWKNRAKMGEDLALLLERE
jgi:hypothetical protein